MSGHGWEAFRVIVEDDSSDPDLLVTGLCACGQFRARASTYRGLLEQFAEHRREMALPRRSPTVDPVVAAADRLIASGAVSAVLWADFERDFAGGAR